MSAALFKRELRRLRIHAGLNHQNRQLDVSVRLIQCRLRRVRFNACRMAHEAHRAVAELDVARAQIDHQVARKPCRA